MSFLDAQNPQCDTKHCPDDIDVILIPRSVDLGGFSVSRVLPSKERRMVGPFVFWDQFGRNEFLTGQGIDVRPHPHIGLATLTYLFEGSIEHRDSLASHQLITPGDVNLMVAGQGIVHSERTSQAVRQNPHSLFGLQIWLGLPKAKEETSPSFVHSQSSTLPHEDSDGVSITLVAGALHGLRSPVEPLSDAMLADVTLQEGKSIEFAADIEERAVHIVTGQITLGDQTQSAAHMLVLKPGHAITITATHGAARIILLGGSALDGPRHLWWNFVSSSKDRIVQAQEDWMAGRFGAVPGDEEEFIPLPAI